MHTRHSERSSRKTKGKAIDGKTIRRSEYAPAGEDKRPHKAVHVVSAQVAFARCVLRAGENGRKINTSMQSIGGVVLIKWLQSALIPVSTAQSATEERRVLKPPHESNEITAIPQASGAVRLKRYDHYHRCDGVPEKNRGFTEFYLQKLIMLKSLTVITPR